MNEEEREVALKEMKKASDAFYYAAQRIGNHPFIEFTGLINEYIGCCTTAHNEGIDFSRCNKHVGAHLPMPQHSIDYINEKLECIFTGRSVVAETVQDEKDEATIKHVVDYATSGEIDDWTYSLYDLCDYSFDYQIDPNMIDQKFVTLFKSAIEKHFEASTVGQLVILLIEEYADCHSECFKLCKKHV